MSWTKEHTELLTHIINHARKNQRHLVVTLIDLKNAFGDWRLIIACSSPYYYTTTSLVKLQILFIAFMKITSFQSGQRRLQLNQLKLVKVHVLQGDCLSPLLFNMCINTLIKCIEDERIRILLLWLFHTTSLVSVCRRYCTCNCYWGRQPSTV